jgi:hypothetical protein
VTTMQQAIHQTDLVLGFLYDDHPASMKGRTVGDVSGWSAQPIFDGRGKEWTSPGRPGWKIFEQPAGFYVWHGFKFAGEDQTLAAAVARVERAD